MPDVSWPLQQAVHARLTGQITTPVYDHVPADATMSYVVIGEDTVSSEDDKTGALHRVTLTLHVWSRHRGRKEVKQILGEVYTALHQAPLVVSGFDLLWIRFDFEDSFIDADGITYHGVQRYRCLLAST